MSGFPESCEIAASAIVYLRRSDLGPDLGPPLGQTLAPRPPQPSTMSRRESQLVEATTAHRAFAFSLTRAQDGNAVLVLDPLAA